MSLYRRTDTGEIRDLAPDHLATLAAAKRALWEPYTPPAPGSAAVPEEVTDLQIRKALSAAGMRDAVEALVAASNIEVRDEWERRLVFRRNNALLNTKAGQLGLTSEDVDNLFRAAAAFD